MDTISVPKLSARFPKTGWRALQKLPSYNGHTANQLHVALLCSETGAVLITATEKTWHTIGTHFEHLLSKEAVTKPFLGPGLDPGEGSSQRWVHIIAKSRQHSFNHRLKPWLHFAGKIGVSGRGPVHFVEANNGWRSQLFPNRSLDADTNLGRLSSARYGEY